MPNWKCGFCMYVLMYIWVYVFTRVYECVGVHMEATCQVNGPMFPALCFHLLFETRSLTWTWSSLIQTNCLASKLHRSTCPHLLIKLGLQVHSFYIGAGGPNSCWCLCGKHFTYRAISPAQMLWEIPHDYHQAKWWKLPYSRLQGYSI